MSNESKFGVPTVVAIATGIATICGLVVTLWVQFAKPSAELGATVSVGIYRVDPWTGDQVSELASIQKALNSYRIQGGQLSESLTKFADDAFKVHFPQFSPDGSYGYTKTIISDAGDLGASDIVLRIPDAVGSLITFDDGSQKTVSGSPNIELGNLRPEQQITVYSWFSSQPLLILDSDKITLTYENGVGKVKVAGQHSWVYIALSSVFMQVYFAIIVIWLLIFLWSTAYRQGWRAAASKDSVQPDEDDVSSADKTSNGESS